jgi:hypothetical protein
VWGNWGHLILAAVVLTSGRLMDGPSAPVPPPVAPPSVSVAPGPGGGAPSISGATDKVSLKVQRDGQLSVVEVVTAPAGTTLHRSTPLRITVSDEADRVFSVSGTSASGPGAHIGVANGNLQLTAAGTSTFHYTLSGSVADLGSSEEMRWDAVSGWDQPIANTNISFVAPRAPKSVQCLAGAVGSTGGCTSSSSDIAGGVFAQQRDLAAGDRIELAVQLPPGTVRVDASVARQPLLASAFQVTPATGGILAGLCVLLLAGVLLLVWLRGRDVRVLVSDIGPVDVLFTGPDGHVAFASPDGVLPGQVGTVADEHVDVVDVAATVIDLAVRNYLWIGEAPGEDGSVADWRILRRNPADEYLTGYERAVYDALLPAGRDSVGLAELGGGTPLDLRAVRAAMYADVVERRWFARRPDIERGRWWRIGLALAGIGVLITVVLTFTVGYAVLGLAVVLAGIALALAARFTPARTQRGSVLMQQLGGLRGYLQSASPQQLPDADREVVFSRSLPYALVLGEHVPWLQRFTEADPSPGRDWYGAVEGVAGPAFPERFAAFTTALQAVLGRAGQLRDR